MKEKNKKNIILPILLVVIALLVFIIVILIMKTNLNTKPYENNFRIDNNTNNNNYLSKEEALNIALNNEKINQSDIHDLSVELDYKYNQTVYEIDFNYMEFEYEYYIDAVNGEIIHSFKERD